MHKLQNSILVSQKKKLTNITRKKRRRSEQNPTEHFSVQLISRRSKGHLLGWQPDHSLNSAQCFQNLISETHSTSDMDGNHEAYQQFVDVGPPLTLNMPCSAWLEDTADSCTTKSCHASTGSWKRPGTKMWPGNHYSSRSMERKKRFSSKLRTKRKKQEATSEWQDFGHDCEEHSSISRHFRPTPQAINKNHYLSFGKARKGNTENMEKEFGKWNMEISHHWCFLLREAWDLKLKWWSSELECSLLNNRT